MTINNSILFLLFAFASVTATIILPTIPEQGEIIISSPGEEQRQQYYIKIRP